MASGQASVSVVAFIPMVGFTMENLDGQVGSSNLQITWPDASYLIKSEKSSKQIVAKRMLLKVFLFLASRTISHSISTAKGDFLLTGLANVLLRPSKVTFTIGEVVGAGMPTKV